MTTCTWSSWVRDQLTQRNWTNADVAKVSGVPASAISQWINKDAQPSVANARKFAVALNLPVLTVMVAAGFLTEEEAGVKQPPLSTVRETHVVTLARELLHRVEELTGARRGPPETRFQINLRDGVTITPPPSDEH